jgi:uncharacterized repeat protein (TIGR03803 family)
MRKDVSSTDGLRNLSICIIILLVSSVFAAAQHEKVIYAFGASSGDGSIPFAGLIADPAGNLYGVTEEGGSSNVGAVYEMIAPTSTSRWKEAVLYSFSGGEDGAYPIANLVLDPVGNLYGTAQNGGNPSCLGGCGTVFELSPPAVEGGSWVETTIYSFGGGNDGNRPYAGLILDGAGNLYGTTLLGGGTGSCEGLVGLGCGTAFELSPPTELGGAWTETVLYSFSGGSDGGSPGAPVVFDNAGNLYGTTIQGGSTSPDCQPEGCGTVFELTPSGGAWTETVLHDFGGMNRDGDAPVAGLLWDKSGALVGTTTYGGVHGRGTVFGLRPPSNPGGNWAYEVLYSFGASQNDAGNPGAGVISFGVNVLYGTTEGGGLQSEGTVFQLTRGKGEVWTETDLYSFKTGSDGNTPVGGVLLHDGALYGTTILGGGSANAGTVFRILQ